MKRSLTAAIVAVALLAGVACSGGGGLAPQTGTKIQLPTPKSVSPALVKAPPMATTAIQPASAMTSRLPASAIVPQNWTQIPGAASQVAAAADGSIWVLSDQPAGPNKYIWHYASGTWTNVGGLASQIAVAPDGTLYVINSAGGVYAYNSGVWSSPGGGAKSITTLSSGYVVVVSNAGAGDQGLWLYNGSWQQLPGGGVSVYGGRDIVSHTVNGNPINPAGVYILNSGGNIYYLNTDNSFALVPASASSLASRPGGLFALAGGGVGIGGNQIYYFDLDSPAWTAQSGAAVSLSIGANNTLYVVSGTGAIYQTATGTTAPTPTPSIPLVVSPNPISLTQTGNANVGVTETGFSGPITAVAGDTNILTVSASPVTMTSAPRRWW